MSKRGEWRQSLKKKNLISDNPFYCALLAPGPERRSVEIDKKNKTITAYHESGHAIVAYYTKDAMPINKATIMPRGPTLGHVSNFFCPLPTYPVTLTTAFYVLK